MEYWNRIDELCKQQGVSFFGVMKNAKIACTSSYQMKNKGVPPTVKTICRFCESIGISLPDFFRSSKFIHMTQNQMNFIRAWRTMSSKEKSALYRVIREFRNIDKNKNNSSQIPE